MSSWPPVPDSTSWSGATPPRPPSGPPPPGVADRFAGGGASAGWSSWAEPRWSPPPAPPAPPASSAGGGWWLAVLLTAVAVFLASALLFAVVAPTFSGTATRATGPVAGRTAPSAPNGANGGSGQGAGSTAMPDVTAAVNPGIVDIESVLPEGIGAGTGMVLTEDGRVLTNSHVVDAATRIEVTVVATGDVYRASVVGADASEDVAVLQLDGASGLATIPLGDSDRVQVGDPIAAIGNAGGRGGAPTVSTGSVIALHQQVTAADQATGRSHTLLDMIHVRANVVPGDSGGALAAADGTVVGMNTAASARSGGRPGRGGGTSTTGEGFAIPINRAKSVAEGLVTNGSGGSGTGTSKRAVLGVTVEAAGNGGARVVGVTAGGGAGRAGIAVGDVILDVDDALIDVPSDLTAALATHRPGDVVEVGWVDGSGQAHRARVTLGAL